MAADNPFATPPDDRHPRPGNEPHAAAADGRAPADEPLRSDALPDSAECPFCNGVDTEQFAAFGSAVSTSQYYCRRCRTVFEYLKWRR